MTGRSEARNVRVIALVMIMFLSAGSPRALAHDEPYSHLDIRLEENRVYGRVMAHIIDLAHEGGIEKPERLLDPNYARKNLFSLHKVLNSHVAIQVNGKPLRFQWLSFDAVAGRKYLAFDWVAPLSEPGAKVEVLGPIFPYDPPHETYLNIYESGSIRHQDLLDRTKPKADYYSGSSQGKLEVVREFVVQGIHHIFIGPDHILFIIGLLLPGGRIGRLLAIITSFTVAHSLTLILATLKLVSAPASIAEPAIALSIILVGLDTLHAQIRGRGDRRLTLAFAFGLIHGFGFAGVLAEFGLPQSALGWSLAAFNVGVEIGQTCIVLLVAPSLAALRLRNPILARRVVYLGTTSIIVAGAAWLAERVALA